MTIPCGTTIRAGSAWMTTLPTFAALAPISLSGVSPLFSMIMNSGAVVSPSPGERSQGCSTVILPASYSWAPTDAQVVIAAITPPAVERRRECNRSRRSMDIVLSVGVCRVVATFDGARGKSSPHAFLPLREDRVEIYIGRGRSGGRRAGARSDHHLRPRRCFSWTLGDFARDIAPRKRLANPPAGGIASETCADRSCRDRRPCGYVIGLLGDADEDEYYFRFDNRRRRGCIGSRRRRAGGREASSSP